MSPILSLITGQITWGSAFRGESPTVSNSRRTPRSWPSLRIRCGYHAHQSTVGFHRIKGQEAFERLTLRLTTEAETLRRLKRPQRGSELGTSCRSAMLIMEIPDPNDWPRHPISAFLAGDFTQSVELKNSTFSRLL